MKVTTTLILAARIFLSLGAVTAVAQSEPPSDPAVPYWTLERQADALRHAGIRDANQAGSPDIDAVRPGGRHAPPFNDDYGSLANPN
jgi:hypothetical protein